MADLDPTRTPIAPHPNGLPPDFDDPESRAWIPRLTIYLCIPISTLFIAIRMYSRVRLRHGLGVDDYLCVAAGIVNICHAAVLLSLVIDDTYGRHMWNVPVSAIITSRFRSIQVARTALNLLLHLLIKLSILLLLRRMFSASKRTRILIWIGIVFNTLSYTTLLIVWLAYTAPRPGAPINLQELERIIPAAYKITFASAPLASATDLYLLVIPIGTILALKMSTSRKIAVCAIFMTGLMTCVISLTALGIRADALRRFGGTGDIYWGEMVIDALGVAEPDLGIICGCLPICFPILKQAVQQSTGLFVTLRTSVSRIASGASHTEQQLPNQNRTAMTGGVRTSSGIRLSTLVRGKGNKTTEEAVWADMQDREGQGSRVELAPFDELQTRDMEYHRQII